jgi:hypothetical protein
MALLRKFSWQRFAPSGLTPSLVSQEESSAGVGSDSEAFCGKEGGQRH